MAQQDSFHSQRKSHKIWVRVTHWVITISFFLLTFTGYEILMVHPRLYWGNVGNDLTPALFELPISRNFQHGGWENKMAFYKEADSPVSMSRTYDIFNQNGWGRSLHFLSAWFLVITGLIYLLAGVFGGHIKKNLVPGNGEFSFARVSKEFLSNFRFQRINTNQRSGYGPLQKTTYLVVIFILLPLVILSGLTMSPSVTAAFPFLLKMFAGAQSARTIHFFISVLLVLFLLVHVVMVIRTGFRQQMRAMTFG